MNIFGKFFKNSTDTSQDINSDNKQKTMSSIISEANIQESDYKLSTNDIEQNYLNECGEVVLLNWCNNSPLNTDYPNYFKYIYNLRDIKSTHKKFIEDGYLISLDNYASFKTLTIPILKNYLSENNLSTSGNKQELIERLVENKIKPPTVDKYVLSEKGKKFLDENKLWMDFHRNNANITAKDFKLMWDKLKSNNEEVSYFDIAEPIILKDLENYRIDRLYSSYRGNIFPYLDILDEQNRISEYLSYNLEVICIDLSGLNDSSFKYSSQFRPWSSIYLNEHQIMELSKNLKFYKKSDVDKIFQKLNLEDGALNSKEMKSIINLALNNYEEACNLIVKFNKENSFF